MLYQVFYSNNIGSIAFSTPEQTKIVFVLGYVHVEDEIKGNEGEHFSKNFKKFIV